MGGSLTTLGSGTLTLTGASTYTGVTTLNAGTVNVGRAENAGVSGPLGMGGSIVFNGGFLQYSGSNQFDYSGRFSTAANQQYNVDTNGQSVTWATALTSMGGALTKSGAGTLTLTNANTYTGATTLNSGTLDLANQNAVQNSTLTMNGGKLVFDKAVAGHAFTIGGLAATTSGSGYDIALLDNAATPNAVALTLNTSTASTYAGILSGGGSLIVIGSGTQAFTGANTYTGVTTLNGGTVNLGVAERSGTSGPLGKSVANNPGSIVLNGGYLQYSAVNQFDYSGRFSTAANQQYNVDTNGQSVTWATALTSAGGSLTQVGAGTLTLTKANTYTGATTLNFGTLILSNSNAVQNSTVSMNGGRLVFDSSVSGHAFTVGGLAAVTSGSGYDIALLDNAATSNAVALNVGNNNANTTYAGVLSGSGSLTKIGTGTLTLTGSNTYTGQTILNAGTLNLGVAERLGTSGPLGKSSSYNPGSIVLNGGYLQYSAANQYDYSNRFTLYSTNQQYNVDTNGQNVTWATALTSYGGSLTKVGAGTLKLTGSNTYTGLTTVAGGILQIAQPSALSSGGSNSWTAKNIIVRSGATLAFNVGGANESATGNVTTFLNALISGGTACLQAGSAIGFDTTNASGGSFTIANNIGSSTGIGGGAVGLTKLGSNTLVLTGTNTYTGVTTLNSGIVNLGVAERSGTSGPLGKSVANNPGSIVLNGGYLQYSAVNQFDYSGRFSTAANQQYNVDTNGQNATWATALTSGSGSLSKTGAGTLTLLGNNTYSGVTTLNGGMLILSGSNTGFGMTTVSTGTLDLSNQNAVQNSVVNLSSSSSTLVFDSSVSGHAFTVGGLAGTAGIALKDNAATPNTVALTLNTSTASTYAGVLSGSGSLTVIGSGTQAFTGANTYTGLITLNGGVVNLGVAENAGVSGPLGKSAANNPGNIVLNGGFLQYSALNQFDYSGRFSTAANQQYNVNTNGQNVTWATALTSAGGSLNKTGAGTLKLTNSNTYTGNTTISGGMLNMANQNALQNSAVTMNGGSLVFDSSVSGHAFTLVGLSGTSGLALQDNAATPNAVALSIGNNNATSTYAGCLSGSGSLTKIGTGTLTLTGSNTYTGTTTVNAGTLNLSHSLALQNSTLTTGGTGLVFDQSVSSHAFTLGGLNGSISLSLMDNGGNGVALSVGKNNISSTYAGVLSGGGSLTKIGTGMLTLTGNNTYTGVTTLTGGTLNLGAAENAGTSGPLGQSAANNPGSIVFNGGFLQYSAVNKFDYSGRFSLDANQQYNVDTNGQSVTWATALTSAGGSLTKSGSGTLTLTGNNSFAGGVVLSGGTVQVGNGGTSGSLGSGGGILDNASLAFNRADSVMLYNQISGSGSFFQNGTGTVTLFAANTFYGNTAVTSGTLVLANSLALQSSTLATGGTGLVFDQSVSSHAFTLGGLSGSGNLSLVDNGGNAVALTVGNNYATTIYAGILSGGGSLTNLGHLTLTGSNTYTGVTTLSSSWVILGAAENAGISGPLGKSAANNPGSIVLNGGWLQYTGLNQFDYSGRFSTAANQQYNVDTNNQAVTWATALTSVSGSLTKSGYGTLSLKGANTYTGVTALTGGTLNLGVAENAGTSGPLGVGGSILFNGGFLQYSAANQFDYSGRFSTAANQKYAVDTNGQTVAWATALTSVSGSLTKSGSGTLTLRGASTYSGPTTLAGGFVNLGVAENAGTSGPLGVGGSIVFNSGFLQYSAVNQFDYSNRFSTANYQHYNVDTNGQNVTWASALMSPFGSLTKNGAGTLTLTGSNIYMDVTTLNGGAVNLGVAEKVGISGPLGTSPLGTNTIILNGGYLQYSTVNQFDYSSRFSTAVNQQYNVDTNGQNVTWATALTSAGGSLNKIGAGTLTLTGNSTYTGVTTLSGGVVNLGVAESAGVSGPLGKSVANNPGSIVLNGGILQYSGLNQFDYSGRFSTAANQQYNVDTNSQKVTWATALASAGGSLTKNGAGLLTLSGSNSFSGMTTINSGTLNLSNRNALQNSTLAMNGSSLVFDQSVSSHAFTFGGLAGISGIALQDNAATPNAVALTVGGNNATTTYAGILSGGGSLIKNGTGGLTLSGANTFTGATMISSGTLVLSNSSALQKSSVNLSSGSALVFDQSVSNHAFTFGGLSGTTNLALTDNGGNAVALTVGPSNSTYAGVLSGGGSFALSSTGTLTFTGANTYTGVTTLNGSSMIFSGPIGQWIFTGGTIGLGVAETPGVSGPLGASVANNPGSIILSGAYLQYSAVNQFDYSGRFSTAKNQQYNVDTNGQNVTWATALTSANGTLTKNGAGMLTLTGANTYTGVTTLNSGTINLGVTECTGTSNRSGPLGESYANNPAGSIVLNGGWLQYSAVNNFDYSNRFSTAANQQYNVDTNGQNVTWATALTSWGGSLTKNGTGMLTLSGSNTYTGATTINAGTLDLANQSAVMSSTVIMNGGNLVFDSSVSGHAFTIGGLAGSPNIALQDNAATPNPVALTLNTTNNTTFSGALSGGGSLTKSGTGTLTLTGANTYTGVTALNLGTLNLGAAESVGTSGPLGASVANNPGSILLNGGFLQYSAVNQFDYSGRFGTGGAQQYNVDTNGQNVTWATPLTSMGGSLIKSGSGTLTLTGANTYLVLTTLKGGALNLGVAENPGVSGPLGAAAANKVGSIVLAGGFLQYSAVNQFDYSGRFSTAYNQQYNVDTNGQNVTWATALTSSGGSLTKNGAGTLTLTGYNTYSGTTTLNGGILNLGVAYYALGLNGTIVFNGGCLQSSAVDNLDYSARFSTAANQQYKIDTNGQNVTWATALTSAGGSLTKNGAGTLTLTGANTYYGATTLNSGTINLGRAEIAGTSGPLGASGSIVLAGGFLQYSAVNQFDYSSRFSSAANQQYNVDTNGQNVTWAAWMTSVGGSLTKNGAGSLKLTSFYTTYTGATTINSGTLVLADQNGLPNSNVILNGGLLVFDSSLSSHAFTVGGLVTSASGSIALQDNAAIPNAIALTIGGNNTDNICAGVLSGSGSLIKNGSGSLTLSASNTYTGATTINGGALVLSNTNAVKNSTLTLSSSSSLVFDSSVSGHAFTIGALTGTTSIALQDNAATPNAVTLTLGGNNATTTYSGVLSGSGSLTKNGTGMLTLSGSNSFSGGTTINSGTLVLANANALRNSALNMNGGGLVFDSSVSGHSFAIVGLAGWGSIALQDNAATPNAVALFVGSNNANTTYAGSLTGSGSLTKNGTGTLTLNNYNTYTGVTTLNSGTINLGAAESAGMYGPLGKSAASNPGNIVLNGGFLQYSAVNTNDYSGRFSTAANQQYNVDTNGVNVTWATALTSAGGSLTKNGTGLLTLTGSNTYTGVTTLNNGTINLGRAEITGTAGPLGKSIANNPGSIVLNGGFLQYSASNQFDYTGRFSTAANQQYNVDTNGQAITWATALSSVGGSLTKNGAGTLTLKGANTYTGVTNLNAGTVNLGVAETAGTSGPLGVGGSIVLNGAYLQYSGSNQFDYSSRFSTAKNQQYNVDTNGQNVTWATALTSATGSLTKNGTGVFTLSGSNSFSGGTTINSGTLNLANQYAVQNSLVRLIGGSVAFDSSVGTHAFTMDGLYGSSNVVLQDNAATPNPVALTLNSNDQIMMQATFAGVLSGNGSLTLSGNILQTLSGSNTYTGVTTLNGGTLNLGVAERTGTSGPLGKSVANNPGSIVLNGGRLQYSAVNPNDYSGRFSTADNQQYNVDTNGQNVTWATALTSVGGSLSKIGVGKLTLTGSNTYTGLTNISSGTLVLANQYAVMNSTVYLYSSGLIFDQSVANHSFTIGGWSGGNFSLADNGSNGVNLSVGSNNASTVSSGIISGWGNLTKTGTGTLTLKGASTYSGTTTLASGIINLGVAQGSGGPLGSSTIVFNGGVLQYSSLNQYDYTYWFGAGANQQFNIDTNGQNVTYSSTPLRGMGSSLTKSGSGTLTLNCPNTYTGVTTLNGGIVNLGATETTGTSGPLGASVANNPGSIVLNGGFLQYSAGNNSDYSGRFSTADNQQYNVDTNGRNVTWASALTSAGGSMTKLGSGTLTLKGANTYTGVTNLNAGTINLGVAETAGVSGPLGVGGSIVLNGAYLQYSGSNQFDYSSRFSAAAGQQYNVDTNGQSVTWASALTSVSGSLTKIGTGVLVLGAANTFSGYTNVTSGTLVLANSLALQNSIVQTGGTGLVFDQSVSSHAFTLGGLTGWGNLTLTDNGGNAVTLTIVNSSSPYYGVLSGAGGIVKTGTFTVTLGSASNFTGTTAVNNGILAVTANGALGGTASHVNVASGATLQINGINYAQPTALVINGSGFNGAGALSTTGSSTYTGAITAQTNASINCVTGDLTLKGGIVKNGTVLTFAGGGTVNIAAVGISGTAVNSDLVVDTATLVLKTTNDYNGPTTVQNGGTLRAGTNNVLPTTNRTDLTLTSGGKLDLQSYRDTVNSLTMSNGQVIGTSGTLTSLGAVTVNGTSNVIGAGVTVAQSGTAAVNGSILVQGALTGAVNVNAGGMLSGTGIIGNTSTYVIVAGGSDTSTQGAISLVDGTIGTLRVNGGLTVGQGGNSSQLNFEVGSGKADKIAVTGTLTLNGSGAKISIARLPGAVNGSYNLMTFNSKSGSGALTFASGSTSMVDSGKRYSLITMETSETLNLDDTLVFNLAINSDLSRMILGGTSAITTTVTNAGLTGDILSYSGLAATATSGTINGGSSGSSLDVGSSGTSTGVTFVGTRTGVVTLTGALASATNTIASGAGGSLGTAGTTNITVVDNRVVSASVINFGRVIIDQLLNGTSNLTTTGDSDHFTSVIVNGQLFNSTSSTSTYGIYTSFNSTGLQSGTTTLTTTGEGLAGESPKNVNVVYTATALDNRVVSATPIAFGRVMINQSVNGISNLTTTGSNNYYTSVTVNGQSFNSPASTGTYGMTTSFATTGIQGGATTLTTTGEGLVGESPIDVNLTYTATALDNRVVSATPESFGRVMVNYSVGGITNLTTTGDSDHFTSVTINGQLFNSPSSTGTSAFNITFTSTGIQTGTSILTPTGEGLVGEAPVNVGVACDATVLDNRIVSASLIDLGRMMINQSVSGTSNLTTMGDSNHFTSVIVNGQMFNSETSTSTYGVTTSFATNGLQSGTTTLITTGEGLAGESPKNVDVVYTAAALDNRVVTADTLALGRVMINQSVSGISHLTTTGDGNSYTAVTVNGQLFNSATSTGTYGMTTSFATTGIQGGTTTLITTGEGLTGESPKNVDVVYTATSLDNRVVNASGVNLGNVLVGYAFSGTSNLTTSGDGDHFTAITVDNQTFNRADSVGTHVVNGTFATSGVVIGTHAATVVGEGLAGEAPVAVSAAYIANVFQEASLSTNSPSLNAGNPIADLTLTNAASSDGGQRAGVTLTRLTSNSENFMVTIAGTPSVGDATTSDITATVGTVQLVGNLLNGYYTSSVTGQAQYTDVALRSQASVADVNWSVSVSGTVSGQTSTSGTDVKQAYVVKGASFAGLGLTSAVDGGWGTVATFLGGQMSISGTVAMSYLTKAEFLAAGGNDSRDRLADIVSISGMPTTGVGFDGAKLTDQFVLQINYGIGGGAYVAWYDTEMGRFVNAIAGNSTLAGGQGIIDFGVGAGNFYANTPFSEALDVLGNYGYDDGVAWAVVDHNSEYTTISVIPEPATWGMLLGGMGVLGVLQRLRRRSEL